MMSLKLVMRKIVRLLNLVVKSFLFIKVKIKFLKKILFNYFNFRFQTFVYII